MVCESGTEPKVLWIVVWTTVERRREGGKRKGAMGIGTT